MADTGEKTEKKKESVAQLYIKGLALHGVSGTLLFLMAYFLKLHLYVYIALGM